MFATIGVGVQDGVYLVIVQDPGGVWIAAIALDQIFGKAGDLGSKAQLWGMIVHSFLSPGPVDIFP